MSGARASRAIYAVLLALAPVFPCDAQSDSRPDDNGDASAMRAYAKSFKQAAATVLASARASAFNPAGTTRLAEVIGELDALYRRWLSPNTGEKADKSFLAGNDIAGVMRREFHLSEEFSQIANAVAAHIRKTAPGELARYGLPDEGIWPDYRKYEVSGTPVARELATARLARYKARYSGGEVLNPWLEVPLDNLFTRFGWFGASAISPPRAEPIARFSPLLYSSATENTISVVEAGLNFYAFGGLLQKFGPVGGAITLGDPTQKRIFLPGLRRSRPGVMLHAHRAQVGWTRDHTGADHLLASFNFHVLPNNWF